MVIKRHHRIWPVVVAVALALAMAACQSTPAPTPTLAATKATRPPEPTFTPVQTITAAPTATVTPLPTLTPTPTANPNLNPLTGLTVADPALLHRHVLAVRVGNDAIIRPQEGLGEADIVYEELMEGYSLTRFTGIYLGTNAERIRPIRSARLVSLAIAPQYNAVLVHSGASDKIRWYISQAKNFTDLDQYYHDEPYGILPGYDWRGRMYTSVERVHDYLLGRGMETDKVVQGYLFDPSVPTGEAATTVTVPYPQVCKVRWDYDSAARLYLRNVAGEPHEDGLTGKQLSAANVIILYAEHLKTDIVEDSLGSTAIDIVLTGKGRAQLFRDGIAVNCTWQRPDGGGLIEYYDDAGTKVPLKPGQTWIELVPPDYEITYN